MLIDTQICLCSKSFTSSVVSSGVLIRQSCQTSTGNEPAIPESGSQIGLLACRQPLLTACQQCWYLLPYCARHNVAYSGCHIWCLLCRPRFWFWESVILTQTLGLAAAQVFATALDAFFQLTIMLVILMISLILLTHYRPFEEKAAQITQVLL